MAISFPAYAAVQNVTDNQADSQIIAQKSNEDPKFDYGAKSQDYVEGQDYFSLENQYVKALIGSTKAKNDQKGPMSNGAIMDAVSKTSNRENLDWTQFVIKPQMDAGWNNTGSAANNVVDLNDISVEGNTIVAKGNYLANPDIKGEVTYSLVEDTPLLKMEVKLTNEGAEDFQGYFEYLTDPDENNEDGTYVPGVGWTTSNSSTVLINHEWTENYIFEGNKDGYSGYTAHAILWDEKDTTPTGLVNDSYIFGAWFDASVKAGESKTLTFYHLAHDPGSVDKPYSEAEFWAKVVRGEVEVDQYGMVEGTVTDREGNPIPNVNVTCEYTDGERTAGTAVTDENGHYSIRVEKTVYTLTASIPGYGESSQSVNFIVAGENGETVILDDVTADIILDDLNGTRITENTSMLSLGGLVEGKVGDYTIENDLFTMTVADETQDSQLQNSSAGRILDIAFNGRQDAMDWLFTSWISDVKPHQTAQDGVLPGDSWIQLDTRFDSLEVVSQSSQKVVLKATGVYHHDLAKTPDGQEAVIEQLITVESGKPYAQIETTIKNTSGQKLDLYVGDAMDLDMSTQSSYAPGIGDITAAYNSPIDEKASQPWFSQYATGQQEIYSFLYEDDFDFNVFGSSNWLMGYAPVSLEDGQSYTYSRQMVVLDTEGYEEAPEAMNAYYNAQEYGLEASMEVYEGDINKGDVFPVKVTINNSSDQPVKDVNVSLTTPYQMFSTEDSTITVDEIPAQSSKTVEFSVLALEGGRGSLKSKVSTGEDVSISFSKAISIGGEGHYAGDNHTHSTNSDGSGTIRQNVDSAYEDKLMNWLYSTDHNAISQRTETEEETKRLEGNFINITGTEITSSNRGHALAYGVDYVPEYRIDQEINGELWTWQDTIDQVNNDGGIFYIAHPNYPGLQFSPKDQYTVENYRGIEVWNGFYHALDANLNVNTYAFDYWDNVNRTGKQKYFGIANSDGHNPGKMADPYIKTEMGELTYDNILETLDNGNYYGSNGPELRYNIEGVGMGETLNLQNTNGETVDFNITAFDPNFELTNVKLIKNVITGSEDGKDGEKEIVKEWDLEGQGLKEFSETVSLTVKPNEFYRIEVTSKQGTTGNGGKGEGQGLGFAFSNPIWTGEAKESNAKDIKEITYGDGEVIETVGENTLIRYNGEFDLDQLNVKVSEGATVTKEYVGGLDRELDSSSAVNITVTAQDGSTKTETVFLLKGEGSAQEDTTAPEITVNGSVPAAGEVGDVITLPSATAQDDVDGAVEAEVSVTGPDGIGIAVENNTFTAQTAGDYTVTYTASDKAGNDAVETFTIRISEKGEAVDNQAPEITIDGEVPASGTVGSEVKLPSASATDNVDGSVAVHVWVTGPNGEAVTLTDNTFIPTEKGDYTVVYSASDERGNNSNQTYTVKVFAQGETIDLQAPEITIDGEVPATGTVGSEVKLPSATAQDNLDGQVAVSIEVTGPDGAGVAVKDNAFVPQTAGNYTVTYTASDEAGNDAVETFTIKVSPKDENTSDSNSPMTGENGLLAALAGIFAAISGFSVLFLKKFSKKQ